MDEKTCAEQRPPEIPEIPSAAPPPPPSRLLALAIDDLVQASIESALARHDLRTGALADTYYGEVMRPRWERCDRARESLAASLRAVVLVERV
jgi:hypothetical protein